MRVGRGGSIFETFFELAPPARQGVWAIRFPTNHARSGREAGRLVFSFATSAVLPNSVDEQLARPLFNGFARWCSR